MFRVLLHNSTTTPSQPGYGQLLRAALDDVQAQALELGNAYRLRDSAEIHILIEAEDDICLIEYPVLSPAVSETIFQIARRTSSLIMLPWRLLRTVDNPGEPPASFALAMSGSLGEVASAADLDDQLAELEAEPETAEWQTDSRSNLKSDRRSLGQRLSDALFGKEG